MDDTAPATALVRLAHPGSRVYTGVSRAACIELTEQGKEIAYAAHRKVTEHAEKLIGDISPGDRERLEHLVWTIVGTPAPRS
ncbi:hypothetical protein ABZW11_24025 [Nonomuraea sp. NPDC004580]|uniref:hypothetical protein n=1 Tax=Nonomuraea sp. NPDC004580 TaxID=3154552 RepID=UPI0033A47D36